MFSHARGGERSLFSQWCLVTGDGAFVHESSCIDEGVVLGVGVRIWHFCHVMSGAYIGSHTSLGQGVHVARGVHVGARVKVQNHVSVFEGVTIEDEVFLGPSCVFTNVKNPRAGVCRKASYAKTLIRRGATIGAGAVVLPGTEVGRHAFIAAGAVVGGSVPDYALYQGVPARQAGWMSRHGARLVFDGPGVCICTESGHRYELLPENRVINLDCGEDVPLFDIGLTGRERANPEDGE